MRDLLAAPVDEVARERARVTHEGVGARLLALQDAEGQWGGAAWNRGWNSTLHVLMLLRDMGLDPASEPALRATGLVRDRVKWQGDAAFEGNPFFAGEAVTAARLRGQEYLLERRLFAFPTWWHYDVLRGLEHLRRAGVTPDERVSEAIALVASKRDRNGRWPLEKLYPGVMPVQMDDGEGQPSRWNTLRALRVLKWHSAGK